jgi:glycosyltransferase involved in cell wall biosynthesis
MNKNLRVSIIIPVYNEEQSLASCLDSIATQTVVPLEVIVVDNNSTDNTRLIAQSYPFVKVLTEARQGVVYARNRGFDLARGDIIGRIDADTVMADDWVSHLQKTFKDDTIAAVTGRIRYNDMFLSGVLSTIDYYWRRRITRLIKPEMPLQGANMALRRQDWQSVRSPVCMTKGLHEDFDLSIHLASLGKKSFFDQKLCASIGLRCTRSSFRDYFRYWMACPGTYTYHKISSRRHMYPVISLLILAYLPLRLCAFLNDRNIFQWRTEKVLVNNRRVNPATFVD